MTLYNLARSTVKAAHGALFHSPHWRIGWRHAPSDDVFVRLDLKGPPWRSLPNPGRRFFADPFPVAWRGRSFLFFEDFDHRTGKGRISAIALGPDGPRGSVFPVLEEPWHLSYPFMMENDGHLWMIPESSANRTVSIYRAVEFPHKWVRCFDLLSDVEASDATVLAQDGRFWLFATVREGGGSHSEALHLFYADRLSGPWRSHRGNPVLVDAGSARSAGNMRVRDGRIWRPVQDCARSYGAALGLAEVTRLDENGYSQVVRAWLRPGREWRGRKLHTLNRLGPLEFIDGSSLALRRFDS